tara:strand:+ start:722 stop:1090 length:369 start_codon:yes stop_codon:yes gene_type:complete
MTKEAKAADMSKTEAETGVIAKLKKHKASQTGTQDTTLPETGIKVTWPKFQSHGMWMKAQRLSKKNPMGVADIYMALICKFDGESMTLTDFNDLVPTGDALHLLGEVMGEDEDEDDAGNALH